MDQNLYTQPQERLYTLFSAFISKLNEVFKRYRNNRLKEICFFTQEDYIVLFFIMLIPVFLSASHFFSPGIPYGADGISNLLPVLHARHSIANGALPIYTDLWYGGMYQFVNPLWKGFYPGWWPVYIPALPLKSSLKAVLAGHMAVAPAVTYYYARKDVDMTLAAGFAIASIMPIAAFQGHYQKILAYPWVLLLLFQLTPNRLNQQTMFRGAIAGVSLSVLLLTGGGYWFFYFGLLTGIFALTLWNNRYIMGLLIGGLLSLPKLALSILPVIIRDISRPPVGSGVSLGKILPNLIGFTIELSSTPAIQWTMRRESYAVIGAPLVGLAVFGFLYNIYYKENNRKWWIAWSTATIGSILLAISFQPLYRLPILSTFRVTPRALILLSTLCILGAWTFIHKESISDIKVELVSVLIMISLITSGIAWVQVDSGQAIDVYNGEQVADKINESGCDSAWIEVSAPTRDGGIAGLAHALETQHVLTKHGISLQGAYYGEIGQQFSVREKNGKVTFDALAIGRTISSNESVPLSGGTSTVRGEIKGSELSLIYTQEPNIHVYEVDNRCA
ncbi:hypothetical protein [Halorhabdus amylolytica]|uniref:hypothetical protein n=1 Tax=Halorhabdus amylolytica TaxID=2559573 RepID=UPI0010AA3BA2|nr:hypothetical protein [Halorhabdus amylolytica]